MKIDEFVKEYVKADEDGKKKLVNEHVVRDYLPYLDKIALAEAIVVQTQYPKDDGGDMMGFEQNTPLRYMITLMQLIAQYTDLEEGDSTAQAFDQLQECGAMGKFIDAVQRDFTIFENVIEMTMDDTYQRETSLVRHFTQLEKDVLDGMQDLVDNVNAAIQQTANDTEEDDDKKESVDDKEETEGEK